MITTRKREARGHYDHGWLDTSHTFSFGQYHDPDHRGFASLRVINEDRVAPGMGFGTHGHRDMEIVSYVVEGAMAHRDSTGNGSTLHAGQFQRMSAGRGIQHSEFNASRTEPLHFYQIWILPAEPGIDPGYEDTPGPWNEFTGGKRLVASPGGRQGSLRIHQDVDLYLVRLAAGDSLRHELAPGRKAWVQVVRGDVLINGTALRESDGAALESEAAVSFEALVDTEILLFDLA
ncbi:MAG: pirin family protein [Candidatus Hydrogenedentes bacterium]|nr:pirin family protein [Candidatus Hydrogenedentota bacterium]